MRTMPFPEYLNAPFRDRLNTFYSVCQMFATCQVLFSYTSDELLTVVECGSTPILTLLLPSSLTHFYSYHQVLFAYHLDEVFAVVWPIQIAAFLMTCVRKSIITAGAWHYYYRYGLRLILPVFPASSPFQRPIR